MQPTPSAVPSAPLATTPAGVPLKWLWAAIAALGLCVLALGATLVAQQRPGAVSEREALASPAPRTPESEIIDEKRFSSISGGVQHSPLSPWSGPCF